MEIALEVLKIACLFLSVLFTGSNVARLVKGNDLPSGNVVFWAIGTTGFIYLQFLQGAV